MAGCPDPESGGGGSLSPAYAPPLPPAGRASGRRGRLADGQRQSASQREKLRMRRLAGALHTLRRFLPPALAPAGRSLTKVETLRLASRYIAHLSDLLGLARPRPRLAHRTAPEAWPAPAPAPSPPSGLPPAAWAPSPEADAEAAWSADGAPAQDPAALQPPPPPEDLSAQSLPVELLALLEGFLSPPAQD